MSPRKNNVLTIEAWPDPKRRKLYKGIIRKADVDKKSGCLHVTIENLDPSQLGRIHEVNLPLPVRAGNKTCSFFAACGIDVNTIGTKVCLDDIAGVVIGMRFSTVGQDGSQQVNFERVEDPSKAPASTPGSQPERAQLGDSPPQSQAEHERQS